MRQILQADALGSHTHQSIIFLIGWYQTKRLGIMLVLLDEQGSTGSTQIVVALGASVSLLQNFLGTSITVKNIQFRLSSVVVIGLVDFEVGRKLDSALSRRSPPGGAERLEVRLLFLVECRFMGAPCALPPCLSLGLRLRGGRRFIAPCCSILIHCCATLVGA